MGIFLYNGIMTKTAQKVMDRWDSLNSKTQRIVTTITSAGIIIGAFFGFSNYIVAQLDLHIQDQMSDVKADVSEIKLSSTRNELLLMIEHNPNNVVEIERLAKVYFVDMKGDFYMTGLYSDWAKKHGGDTSFVVYH